jgi:DNA invertase Pin-like site-specific DNA recombinase
VDHHVGLLRIGVWAAVSSRPQADESKESLPAQVGQGERFAAEHGGEVVATYRVPGHSRDYIFYSEAEQTMPAYAELRQDVHAGRLDVLWALDADRLGRDPALVQQVISLVEKGGGEVYLANSPHVLGSKSIGHRYVSAIQAIRAGEDQAIRVARHRMGMKGRIIRKGLHPGVWPYGYEAVRDKSGEVVGGVFTDDIDTVRLITRWFLAGVSYKEIVRRLYRRGIPSPAGARRWNHSAVMRLMHRDFYAGYPSWGPWRAEERSDKYPSLWDADEHRAILNERRRRDTGPAVRSSGRLYTGVAFCARCRGPMVRHTSWSKGRAYYYWRCSRRCHWNGIREETLTRAMRDWLAQPEQIEASLAELANGGDLAQIQAEMDTVEQNIQSLTEERRRLADAVAGGLMDAQMYREADDERLAQIEQAQSELDALERQAEAVPDVDERREQLEALAWSFPVLVLKHEPVDVARTLVAAHLRIWCEDGEIVRISTD